MVRVTTRESTPLLYGSADNSVQQQQQPSAALPDRRRWKYAVSAAALFCTGTWVNAYSHSNSSSSADVVNQAIRGAQVDFHKTSKHHSSKSDATSEFFTTLEAFKNENTDPCVDFFEYACGGWLAQNEIPSDGATIDSAFYVVGEDNKKIVRKIIDSNPPLISEFYASCLNAEDVDKDAVAYVAKLIDAIHQINSTVGLLSYAGELDQSYGISSFFSVGVGADPKDPTTNLLQLSQGGLTLPSREYYLEASKSEQYSALFAKYVSDLFTVEGLEKHNASEYASAVYDTETKFAEISLTNAELRDPWTTNDAYSFADIDAKYPYLAAYLDGISKQEPFPKTHAIVSTPAFFKAQNDVLKTLDVQQLKQYLSFHVLDSFGASLGEYFRRASHDFHGTVQGAGSLSTRDKFCVDSTTSYLGAYLGEYYMQEVFGSDAKASAQALVQEIEASMKRLLQTEEWLDRITYDAAVAKLERVRNYIGGPDAVPDLPFELHADNYFDNVVSLLQLGASETIQGVGEPVDATKWDMFPSTVNAYYDPSANKMVFPAAILQPPFYSADKFPAAANYARIGMVMGHELSHGFDDQGRNYDGNGTLRKWWSASVSDDFTARAQCLSAQYSSFPVITEDGVLLGNVNGNLTLGENIADNGGIHLAYQAYKLSQVKEEGEEETPAPETEEPTVPVVPVVTKEKKKEKKEPVDEKDEDDKKKSKTDKDEDEGEDKKKKSEKDQDEKKAEKSKSEKDEDKKKSEKSKSDKDEDEKNDKKKSKSEKGEDKDEDKEDDKESSEKKVAEKKVAEKKSSEKEDKKPKKVDEKDEKEDKKSKKDDDEEDEDDKKKSKKSSEDDEDDKKSKKSKKSKDDEEDEKDDDKKHKKSKKSDKDDDEDVKKSKKHKSKKDDEEEDKHSKKHKSKKDDEEEDKHSKKHKSKKYDDMDEDKKHDSKKHKKDEKDGEDDKKHKLKSKKDDNEDEEEEEKHHHKKHHHLRRQLAFASIKLSKIKAVAPEAPATAGGNGELSAEIKDDRLFFTAFAQNWCEKLAPAFAELVRATDPHSPDRWRVNGPLKNFDKFAAAFQCKLGTPMNPDKKCLVW